MLNHSSYQCICLKNNHLNGVFVWFNKKMKPQDSELHFYPNFEYVYRQKNFSAYNKKSRATQKKYGRPRLSPWVARWATQDFSFCAALLEVSSTFSIKYKYFDNKNITFNLESKLYLKPLLKVTFRVNIPFKICTTKSSHPFLDTNNRKINCISFPRNGLG